MEIQNRPIHTPVLLNEVISALSPRSGGIYIDGTLGLGGHSSAILSASGPNGRVIGIDHDADAIQIAKKRLSHFGDRFTAIHGNFADLSQLSPIQKVDGIILDLGVSSLQIDTPDRGFSFLHDGKLDMRMDRDQKISAFEIVNRFSKSDLQKIIREFGEDRFANRIAQAIVNSRRSTEIHSTQQLAQIIKNAVPKKSKQKIHPATRTFQAIRIFVNREIENLEIGIRNAIDLLKPNGKLCVISFHSLEDRIVKHYFRFCEKDCICPPKFPICNCDHHRMIKIITKRPITPTPQEIENNPRSRSAKLRICVKISEKC